MRSFFHRIAPTGNEPFWLIAGLGNPGRKHESNWHNCGFMVLDILAGRHQIPVDRLRHKGLTGQGRIAGRKSVLLKPLTYMNLSGDAVAAAVAYYKVLPACCLVIYDDVDIPVGQIRIRESGGAGSHNGMRSVIDRLGREDFPRIRLGIGPKPEAWDIADYVLSDIPALQRELMAKTLNKAADAVEMLLGEGLEKTMNYFNRR
ncbi:MAG: aminoacyl-tRNA hydrolase [Clostridiaceae bacterium]|nr:aminoacyl-tRNA hydrolase [Clostridiaceae bacterium]